MDILEANLRHLLPSEPPEKPSKIDLDYYNGLDRLHNRDIDETFAEREYLRAYFSRTDKCTWEESAAEAEDLALELLTEIADAFPSWEVEMLEKILRTAEAICDYVAACPDRDPLSTMGRPLTVLGQMVDHIVRNPRLFPTSQTHDEFFRKLLDSVKRASCSLNAFQEFESVSDDTIEDWLKYVPRNCNIETDRSCWVTWTANTVKIGSDEMRKAILHKSNFKIMSTFLPRGGCAIAEQWRRDVNDVVDDMLQSNGNSQVESQIATERGTFLTSDEERVKHLTRVMQRIGQPGGCTETTWLFADTIFATVRRMEALEDFEPVIPGNPPSALRIVTYMTMLDMREAREERAAMIKDMGYLW